MENTGVNLGLDRKLSYQLAKETAIGSIHLLQKSGEYAGLLRKKIAVKGGTTEAAIKKLNKNSLMKKVIFNAVKAAFNRSKQIGKKTKTTK